MHFIVLSILLDCMNWQVLRTLSYVQVAQILNDQNNKHSLIIIWLKTVKHIIAEEQGCKLPEVHD